jgi:hypothetical protein
MMPLFKVLLFLSLSRLLVNWEENKSIFLNINS